MTDSEESKYKPPTQPRSALTRKSEADDGEPEAKPTLSRKAVKMTGRLQRIVEALNGLNDERLQTLTTRIGPDELAVALLDADDQIKGRIAQFYPPDKLEVYKQYLEMGKERLPSDVIDQVQGKLLRLTN